MNEHIPASRASKNTGVYVVVDLFVDNLEALLQVA